MLVPVLMKKIRRETLGDSISFCISGGGACNKDTFRIVNGCGYHLENGYGMTEIGIACVTLKKKAGDRDGKTVGKIFPSLNTSLSSNGHLMVKGDSCFAYRYADGVPVPRDTEAWFDTGDCFDTEKDGELLFKGREDDLINSSDGERINPETIESLLSLTFPVCVVCLSSNVLTMLVGASGGDYVSKERRMQVVEAVNHAVEKLPVHMRPRRVLYTYETIPVSLSFKYRRKEITRLLEQELLTACNAEEFISPEGRQTAAEEENAVVNEIIGITKDILNCTDEVTPVSNFFTDLGGDSLSYIEYLNALETHFRIRIPKEETGKCVSPLSVYHVIAGAAKTER
ncbi:MAG: hypothetical protein CW338_08165 [Clostridiales bacterium]|nr:hypothetical protein [Clostridiales bacterium]